MKQPATFLAYRHFHRSGTLLIVALIATVSASPQSSSFGPIAVPGTAVIFDPDDVLSAVQLAALRTAGPLSPTPAVKALSFSAAPGQTFTFSASGLVGCCSVANIGPDGYPNDPANITSLPTSPISGFISPNGLPLLGVFTDGSPNNTTAPAPYNYSAGIGQASFSPQLNQVFVIGDGLTGTGSGAKQIFNVPGTATELLLGFADGGTFQGPPANYGDNVGSLTVAGTLSGSLSCTDNVKLDQSEFEIMRGATFRSDVHDDSQGYRSLFFQAGFPFIDRFFKFSDQTFGIKILVNSGAVSYTGPTAEDISYHFIQVLKSAQGNSIYKDNVGEANEWWLTSTQSLPLLDTVAQNGIPPYYVTPRDITQLSLLALLEDSPEVHAPLLDLNNHPLTRMNYTKTFESYFGCHTPQDEILFPIQSFPNQTDPRHYLRTLAIVTWTVHYTPSVLVDPVRGGVLRAEHLHGSYVSVDSTQFFSGSVLNEPETVVAPTANTALKYQWTQP